MMPQFVTSRKTLPLGGRTFLLGILNVTPDSFSDGGEFVDTNAALGQFQRMCEEGADIIDVGGESTRPGHTAVPVEEEIRRVVPLIEQARRQSDALISIDTSKAAVAEAALQAGADIVNDVWGAQRDPEMAESIARHGAACILMHNRPPEEAGIGDVIEAILRFWKDSVGRVLDAGVSKESIILDPGLGFGKGYEENWMIMRRLPELMAFGFPLLVGASRKSMLAKLLGHEDPKDRLSGTLATTAVAIRAGVDFIRVHDVKENRDCATVADLCFRNEQDQD